MNPLKKTIAGFLAFATMFQSFLFLSPQNAQALDIKAASSSVVAAGIGCAVNGLLERKLSEKFGGNSLGNEIEDLTGASLSVEVTDAKTEANTKATANKETCFKKVARAAAQIVLRELTRETVNWINTGFDGQPLYIRNPESFFRSIRDQEIGGLAATFSDKTRYPFGGAFIRGYVQSLGDSLEKTAQYSLNESLGGYTSQQFYRNFNNGGWKAWDAYVLPQNNPIGFSLMTTAELTTRLAGTSQSKAQNIRDELAQGNGFLSQKVCVDPRGYVAPQNTISDIETLESAGLTLDEAGLTKDDVNMCRRYETTTPGGVIANQLTGALDNGRQNLLIAPEDLDASLQAVFDALANQLFKKGLASLSDTPSAGNLLSLNSLSVYSSGGYGNNAAAPDNANSTAGDGDQWFNQHPDFDITDIKSFDRFCGHDGTCYTTLATCLSVGNTACEEKGVIPDQQNYVKAIMDDPSIPAPVLDPQTFYPSVATLSTSQKGQNYWLSRIVPEIYQLDYCIPGPHPGWENSAQTALVQYEGTLKDVSLFSGNALGEFASAISVGLIPAIVNISTQADSGYTADELARMKANVAYIYKFSGIQSKMPDDNIRSRDQVVTILDSMFSHFVDVMHERFSPANLPSVAGESAAFLEKVSGYETVFGKNIKDVTTLQGIVRRLGEMRDQVSDLNAKLASDVITQAEYDNSIGFVKRSFANLASNLVNEEDTQAIKSQIQEIQSDLVYIHNSLLKGPNGCEAQIPLVPAFSRVRAWPYPYPHYYDYPRDTGGAGIIDVQSLGMDQLTNNLVTGTTKERFYYPFMEYSYFGGSSWGATHPGWLEVYITNLMSFMPGSNVATVGWLEAKLGVTW